ncbi:MAG: hypothetical protein IPL15_05275 [Comamonadaceae bacterium]|jgi:hypothetical protein|uniref:hypothetical protein n=1 Tax=Candidatus Skiveiella danica TaxID=3386177 RepID=UPI0009C78A19|nr:hypothetical protein [Comamonadaceae bacterium]MBK9988395.1 hypothetical protein [Betaproteobacteria bacterium]MBP6308834.1 hypothetical protein [Burkholderiaceae bacterium]OQC06397.1 MAG: hypothetical protein BWX79_02099 [Alphaproteobacteria bacterium ADurb.Bin100]MBK6556021.1 hypothetical protein [Comamonadaceae bacterium]
MTIFTKTVLFTDADGRAKFREETLALSEGTPQAALSPLMASGGYQLRQSPVGFRSSFHCTGSPQWLIVLRGQMEIGLQDGSSRVFGPGDHFYSADTLPEGATFDPAVHGHWSRQVGPEPLVTLFVRG